MNTKYLMVASSVALGAAGLAATFAPVELLGAMHGPTDQPLPVLVQVLGALYIGFAMVNWTAKGFVVGGIYSRPLTLGNFVHFTVGAIALLKHEYAIGFSGPLLFASMAYAIFAICFGYLVFGRGAACATTTSQSL
ncbi:MAG: hypothetical protein K8R92_06725 [Planctomycetes bacterium]|nr:hypothetical protein [Planctomycetota bacterium]